MAQALYPSTDHRPTPQDIDRYLVTHTTMQAAQHWNVNERTIRKWRARAESSTTPERAQDERNTPASIESAPTFTPTSDDVAGCGTMWLDPWSKELMPIVPGTHRRAWEAERIAARERHAASLNALGADIIDRSQAIAPAPVSSIMSTEPAQQQEHDKPTAPASFASEALQSDEAPGPAQAAMTWVPTTARSGPAVDINIKGIKAEEQTNPAVDIVAWMYEHAPLVQLAGGVVFVALIVVLFRM